MCFAWGVSDSIMIIWVNVRLSVPPFVKLLSSVSHENVKKYRYGAKYSAKSCWLSGSVFSLWSNELISRAYTSKHADRRLFPLSIFPPCAEFSLPWGAHEFPPVFTLGIKFMISPPTTDRKFVMQPFPCEKDVGRKPWGKEVKGGGEVGAGQRGNKECRWCVHVHRQK